MTNQLPFRQTILAFLLIAAAGTARAEAATRPAQSEFMLSAGVLAGVHSHEGRGVGGEAALWWMPARPPLFYGIDAGLTGHTRWAEAQIAGLSSLTAASRRGLCSDWGSGWCGRRRGLPSAGARPPGPVCKRRCGLSIRDEMPLPLLPYFRIEAYDKETVVGAGLMFKLALPLRPSAWKSGSQR